ncbi:MAG: transcription elongation factor GreA [Deltaproteobacteria bacterium]|jgi:transcription elongation factor GreA|nr:MAG: transcription elongation factor GreA [Deltaproteobacteria bacterium]
MELPIVKRLKQELETLSHELNVRIPKDLQEAAAHGDLSENAEYEAARARQDFVRVRIAQLEERLRQLSLYNLSSIPHEVVAYGSRVKLEDIEAGEILEYQIVFPEEVDPAVGHISLHSPIGQALLRKAVGDEVEVVTPQGKRCYQIIDLVTLHDLAEGSGA